MAVEFDKKIEGMKTQLCLQPTGRKFWKYPIKKSFARAKYKSQDQDATNLHIEGITQLEILINSVDRMLPQQRPSTF